MSNQTHKRGWEMIYKEAPSAVLLHHTAGFVQNRQRLSWWFIALIFLFRLFLCVSVITVEAPDEWWQSTEVAYQMVFGEGHLPWEFHYGMRSPIFPGIFAVPFLLLKVFALDTAWTVWFLPRALQALVLTCIDISVFRIGASIDELLKVAPTETVRDKKDNFRGFAVIPEVGLTKIFRPDSVASFSLFLSLTNWYMAFAGIRTYSNVMETLIVLLVMQQSSYLHSLILSAIAVSIRPTSAVSLFPLLFTKVISEMCTRGVYTHLLRIIFLGLFVIVVAMGVLLVIDSLYYKRLVFVPFVFFYFNVIKKGNFFFGDSPWHYYVWGLSFIAGPHILFAICAPIVFLKDVKSRKAMRYICKFFFLLVWMIVCFSQINHKEFRFIFTALPLCFVSTAFVLSRCQGKWMVHSLHRVFFCLNVVLILFFGYAYRRGPLDVVAEIRNGPLINRLDVITTCYTTPGLSYVHKKVNHLGAIYCPVEIDKETGKMAPTEDSIFRNYPVDYVLWKYDGVHTFNERDPEDSTRVAELQGVVVPKSRAYPDVMVMFRALSRKLKDPFLDKHRYRLYRTFLHTPISVMPYEDTYIEIWVRNPV